MKEDSAIVTGLPVVCADGFLFIRNSSLDENQRFFLCEPVHDPTDAKGLRIGTAKAIYVHKRDEMSTT